MPSSTRKSKIEAPWKLLGGLDYGNEEQMRLVMAMIHDRTNPDYEIEPRYSWRHLHRKEREIINRMLRETKGNYLLYSMLTWFSIHYDRESEEIHDVVDWLRKNATNGARHRREYPAEYQVAKTKWKAFMDENWNGEDDLDNELEAEGMVIGRHGEHIRMTLDQMKEHLATFETEYVRPSSYVNEDDYPTDEAYDETIDETESEDIFSEEEVMPKKNMFTEPPKIPGTTRSGRTIRNNDEVWAEFPGIYAVTEAAREQSIELASPAGIMPGHKESHPKDGSTLSPSHVERIPAKLKPTPKPMSKTKPNSKPANKATVKSALKKTPQETLEHTARGPKPKPKSQKAVAFAATVPAAMESDPRRDVQSGWEVNETNPFSTEQKELSRMTEAIVNRQILGYSIDVPAGFLHESQGSVSKQLSMKTHSRKLLPASAKPLLQDGLSNQMLAMELSSEPTPRFPPPKRGIKRKAEEDPEWREDGKWG